MKPIMNWKRDLVRFNVAFGPGSLFERVHFKMKDVHTLNLQSEHYKKRLIERNIPQEVIHKLENFDTKEWTLRLAEVRRDRGKFYCSTWEYVLNGERYWATIATGNKVLTIVKKDLEGFDQCIRDGEYFDFVEKVNRELMDAETIE